MRTRNSIRNSFFAIGGQFLTLLLSFVTRTIFIKTLGASYLGINGLFINVLSILSFAELGVGTAIIYCLYKPFAENDIEKISALMNFYAKAYKLIGLIVAVLGLALVPFLNLFIKDKPDIPNLTLIYLLFLLNSVASYFFVYKRSIIFVSQNGHLNTINQSVFLLLQNIAQILVLFFFHNYILYLIIQIVSSVLSNVLISIKVDQMFPYLRQHKHAKLDDDAKKLITKNVVAMMSQRFGSVIVSGTDNLLISSFVGVVWVGLYSNYILISSTITILSTQIFNAITASVGNLNAEENTEKSYFIFNALQFINFWFFGFSSITLAVMFNPFIEIWVGKNYLLDYPIVLLITLNFFLFGMRQILFVYTNTYGLFWQLKYKPIVEALINFSVSLFFLMVLKIGIYGVLLGTTSSTLLTNFWWEPLVIFKDGFHKSVKSYFQQYFLYVLTTMIGFLITYWLCEFPVFSGIMNLLYRGVVCLVVVNGVFFVCFYRTERFHFLLSLFTNFLSLRRKNALIKKNAPQNP